jgi:hypothetical protein
VSVYALEVKMGKHILAIEIGRDGPPISFEEAREMLVRLAIHITNPSELDPLAQALSSDGEPRAPRGLPGKSVRLRRVK